jgi:hypothetical protein
VITDLEDIDDVKLDILERKNTSSIINVDTRNKKKVSMKREIFQRHRYFAFV